MSKLIVDEIEKYGASQLTITTGTDVSMGGALAVSGNLAVDTDTLYVSALNNRVGIGTSSPVSPLTLKGDLVIQDVATTFGTSIGYYSSSSLNFQVSNYENGNIEFITNGLQSGNNKLVLDSNGNVGIGVSPSAWDLLDFTALQVGNSSFYSYALSEVGVTANAHYDGGWKYTSSDSASMYFQDYNSNHVFRHAASGTAGTAITWNESMRIDSSGNVGIGTSSPTSAGGYAKTLQVSDASAASISVSRTSATASSIEIGTFSGSNLIDSIGSGIPLRFKVDGSERMRIDSSGAVSIGTTDANSRKFRVYGSGDLVDITSTNTGAGGAQIDLRHESSSPANNDVVGIINFNGRDSGLQGTQYAGIQGIATDVSAESGALAFSTRTSASMYTEKMRIWPTGNVSIGTLSNTYKLDVNGDIRATGDITAFSDIRVKENIKTIDKALDKVLKLRGVEYNKIDSTQQSIGVIAQEIEEVIPEVVREDDQGMKSVTYGNITAVLIEAIKEQQKQIEELKSKVYGTTK